MITEKLKLTQLIPNYSDSEGMTNEQFNASTAEIKENGDVLSRVFVRAVGDRYQIVDGEHICRAAEAAGLREITCEIAAFNDFEAMSYPRRQSHTSATEPVPSAIEILEQGGWTCSFQTRSRAQIVDYVSPVEIERTYLAIATKGHVCIEISHLVKHLINTTNHSTAAWQAVLGEALRIDPIGMAQLRKASLIRIGHPPAIPTRHAGGPPRIAAALLRVDRPSWRRCNRPRRSSRSVQRAQR